MPNLINHSEKWAFLHIPKTGGVSLTTLLYHESPNIEFVNESLNHPSINFFPEMVGYYVFTIIRNPFHRFLSGYFHHIRDFENSKFNYYRDYKQFVDETIKSQTLVTNTMDYCISTDNPKLRKVNFFIKFENYKNDIDIVLNKLNINNNIGHINKNHVSSKYIKNYQMYNNIYKENPWLVDFVVDYYKVDFENYGYDKNYINNLENSK